MKNRWNLILNTVNLLSLVTCGYTFNLYADVDIIAIIFSKNSWYKLRRNFFFFSALFLVVTLPYVYFTSLTVITITGVEILGLRIQH